MAREQLKVDVLGTTMLLATDEDISYLSNLVRNYKDELENTRQNLKIMDPLKLSILTGIRLADELNKCKNKNQPNHGKAFSQEAEMESITGRLIDELEKVLDNSN